jgi:hypothetical protein
VRALVNNAFEKHIPENKFPPAGEKSAGEFVLGRALIES